MRRMKNIFLDNLNEIHEKSGMNTRQVADKLGCSWQGMRYWLTGKRMPSCDDIEQLAAVYGVSWHKFFSEGRKAA